MQSFEELSRELALRGKAEQLRALADSAAGRELAASLDAGTVASAAGGDAASVRRLLEGVLHSAEGRRLLEDVQRLMKD